MNRVTETLANSLIHDPPERGLATFRPDGPGGSCREHARQPPCPQTTTILAPLGYPPSPPPLSERPPNPFDGIESP